MNEAETFVEYAESKGETYDPGEDFTPAAEYGGFLRKYKTRLRGINHLTECVEIRDRGYGVDFYGHG